MVPKPHIAPSEARDEVVAMTHARVEASFVADHAERQARRELEQKQAQTERLRVLADFLSRPIHAHGGTEPDPDIVVAYNLAVEAALQSIRRAALSA